MNDPRPIRIIQPNPARIDTDTLVFCAEDADGALQVYVTPTHWASLMA